LRPIQGLVLTPHMGQHSSPSAEMPFPLEARRQGQPLWRTQPKTLLSVERFSLAPSSAKELLFTLESHHSPIDREVGPRPYVYDLGPRGLIAKWRGSSLAWPLIDAHWLQDEKSNSFLCALHRGDSFLTLNPATKSTRTAVYLWNGFGFSGSENPDWQKACEKRFDWRG
jgi:poly-gamma-glutamate synthesis protein (capsule biosynthesis protein)